MSQAPKQEPAQIKTLALVSDFILSAISLAFGFKPSGSWIRTEFALVCLIFSIAFESCREYIMD